MNLFEIAQVQDYLRRTFDNNRITIKPPPKPTAPVEVMMGEEFIGTLHRDDDDGDLCFHFQMTILEMDLK